jgi:hypothetical protein
VKPTSKILSLLIAAAAMLPLSSVRAQAPTPTGNGAQPAATAIEMTVTPAFEGVFKYGEWLPLSIELSNNGQDLESEVRVRVPRNSGGVTFTTPVSLPAGAHKLVTLFILPNNFSHSVDVELVSGGEVLATKKAAMKPMMNVNVIIGLATSDRGALSILNGVQYPNNQRPVQVVDVDLMQLPEQIEGLRSFDVLVFNNLDTSKLTPDQVAALRGWVQNGGRLILGGGSGADRTLAGIPQDLLPVSLDGQRTLKAADLAGLVDFTGGVKIQSEADFAASQAALIQGVVLAGDESNVLAAERPNGKGFVDFVALDLSAAPFEGWSSTQRFWEKLLRSSEDFFNQPSDISQRSMRANQMMGPLTMIPSMELPSIKWLALILGVYILIVGPGNYWLLKRRNKLHWAWFTIPGITILFSAAAFGSGYLMKGNDLLIHKIGVLEIQPGGSAQISSYMGLFSPSQKSYQVEVPGGSLLSPIMDEYSPYGVPAAGAEMTIQQGKPSILSGLAVNQWSMQSFMTEQTIPDYGRITGQLKMEDGRLVGKVRNGLKTPLKDATLILRNTYQRLGDLAAGAEVDVNFDPTPNLAMRGMPVYYTIYEEQMANASVSERALIDLKRSVLSPLFDNQVMVKFAGGGVMGGGGGGGGGGSDPAGGLSQAALAQNVLVIGWVDELPPDIQIAGEEATVQTLGLTFDMIPYELATAGKIVFPPGLLAGHVIKSDAGTCGPIDSVSMYIDRNMEATAEYLLPDPQSIQYSQLDLRVQADQNPGSLLPVIALYDWDAEKWVKFPEVAAGTNTIEKPGRFIDTNGSVQIKVNYNEKAQMGGCIFLEIGFEGQGKGGSK